VLNGLAPRRLDHLYGQATRPPSMPFDKMTFLHKLAWAKTKRKYSVPSVPGVLSALHCSRRNVNRTVRSSPTIFVTKLPNILLDVS
jgi:hypothetical protein